MDHFENEILTFTQTAMTQDFAHDMNHIKRVVKTAKQLCSLEQACAEVVIPAAYLHDCFSFGKNHPNRSQSSKVAADKAIDFLTAIGYSDEYLSPIHHAIVAHSFSAQVVPKTLEAEIVQDADRLDALGAIGIARCIQTGEKMNRPLYSENDCFCYNRDPNDLKFTLDHFYTKLLLLEESMNTDSATIEARKRTSVMKEYLQHLKSEVE